MDKKDLNYYMNLPYQLIVQKVTDEDETYYYGRVLELDGCQSHGDSVEEVYASLREAMEGWLEVKLEHGDPIPEPLETENYSGKFVMRLPKSLHQKLAIEAKQEGVSLNQLALHKLSK